jgi:DMSO/TMAO reductase YedYZ molybdopterin-dependent catalytic subunit
MERRTFIIAGVAGGIGLAEYIYVSGWMNHIHQTGKFSVKAYEPYGEKAALVAITPNDDFYVTSKGTTPYVKVSKWQLKVDGLVSHPFTLNYEQVLALPRIEKELTLECISNSIGGNAFGTAKWTGTPLKPLLERAGPSSEASYAILHAADGFTSGHPIARLWNEENFLAYQMNGQDLPPDHGYPMRIFIPGKFGMKQPKWITRIELVNRPYKGYWESSGWSETCERWAHARFSDLKDGAKLAKLSGKNLEFTGYAIGNLDGIQAVEISFDHGQTWERTNLFSNPSPIVWTFWKYVWVNPKPGQYQLRVRAIDGTGKVEDYGPRGIFPDGATGQQVLEITVA